MSLGCTVTACGAHVYKSINSLWRHWKDLHRRLVRHFRCPSFHYHHVHKEDAGRHLRNKHHLSPPEASEAVATLESVAHSNVKYVEPSGALCPKRRQGIHDEEREEAKRLRKQIALTTTPMESPPRNHLCKDKEVEIITSSSQRQSTEGSGETTRLPQLARKCRPV